MRLNKKLRDNFIRAVMAGVPLLDNHDKVKKILQAAALKECPASVKAMYKDEQTRPYLRFEPYYINTYSDGYHNWHLVLPRENGRDWKPDADTNQEVRNLIAEQGEDKRKRQALETMLTAMVKSINTTDKLREAFPEWASLIPKDELPNNLPVPADLMDRFKQAGWKKKKVITA